MMPLGYRLPLPLQTCNSFFLSELKIERSSLACGKDDAGSMLKR